MENIVKEFVNGMEHLRNNLYFSYFAVAFIEQKPFNEDLEFPEPFGIVTAEQLNATTDQIIDEYQNWIRRHFVIDMVLIYEKYATRMISTHKNNGIRIEPSLIPSTRQSNMFENMPYLFTEEDKKFITQLRRIKNCVVHYNGQYSKTNKIDYTFDLQTFISNGNEGKIILFHWNTLMWMYIKLLEVVQRVDTNYFKYYTGSSIND